jgi:hypothetical protein
VKLDRLRLQISNLGINCYAQALLNQFRPASLEKKVNRLSLLNKSLAGSLTNIPKR